MDVKGIALVTGASRGIGREVAAELARVGFDVLATMRDPSAWPDPPERVAVVRLDVNDLAGFEPPTGLRVLVNNAGVDDDHRPVEHTSLDTWRWMFETNLFAAVELTRRSIPALRATAAAGGGAAIVNVTSSSVLAPVPFYAAYRASKAALGAASESLRTELQPLGVRVVEVLPGPIDTDMLADSDGLPGAADYDDYRPMAEAFFGSREGIAEFITPPADAARSIVAAVLSDATPDRIGCDPLARQMLGQPDG